MKTIRRIQYEKVKELYRKLLISRDEMPDSSAIDKLAREVLLSTLRTPMCGRYRLPSHDTVDIDSLNAELGLIKADAETIYTFLDEMQKRLRTLRYVASVWKQNAKSKVSSAMIELAKMTSPVFIKGFTEELNLMEIMSPSDTTLAVGEDGSISPLMTANAARKYKHRGSDISIQRIGDQLTATILGTPTNIVNLDERGSLVLNLSGNIIEESGFRIEITTDTQAVNMIYLQFSDVKNGVKLKVETSSNKVDFNTVFDSVTTLERIDIPIVETDLVKLIVTMTMDIPSRVLVDQVHYEFKLDKILMLNDQRKTEGVYQTKEIPIEEDITIVSLATEETATKDCTISYYLTAEKDSENNPIGFSYMDTKAEGSFLTLKSGTAKTKVALPEDTNYWKLTQIKTYGARLYNVLETAGDETAEDYSISSGQINIAGGDIIQDTIKLYRGLGDYVQVTDSVPIEKRTDWISMLPDLYDQTEWVKRVPLRVALYELIETVTDYGGGLYNRFTIPYTVLNYEELKITRSDGTQVTTLISEISSADGVTTVTLGTTAGTTVLDPAYQYHAGYTTSLKEYADDNNMTVALDIDTLEVEANDNPMVYAADYIFYEDTLEIELLKTGSYQAMYSADYENPDLPLNLCEDIRMKYTYTTLIETETAYYETYVYANTPVDIIILPFTSSEISVGNFHIVNGDYCSASSSYTLSKGWNKIETSQPYPSLNDVDVNTITGIMSNAGIVISEELEMRAYLDSMRQVTPYKLATLGTEDGSKCFAYSEGTILVNFEPTFIDENFLVTESTAGMVGSKFLNKRASYDSSYNNTGWTPVPEQFGLEFGHTESGDKSIFIKATIDNSTYSSFGKITRIGLNKYKEI